MRFCILFLVFLIGPQATAHTFGIVGKSVDDGNFVDVWRGCENIASKHGDHCVLLGGKGAAHALTQAAAIKQAVATKKYAALAISVTKSDFIAKTVESLNIPIVTFDSPFSEQDKHLSLSYIGIDNEQFGRDLAKAAMEYRPQGGTVCIMTAAHDTNLEQRVLGIRREFSGLQLKEGKRLTGQNNWTEVDRCPWDSGDNITRAMGELNLTLAKLKPDVFISVGWWPIVDSARYQKVTKPFYAQLKNKQPFVIVGVGKITSEYEALMAAEQLHGLVSIDFTKIGRLSYEIMKAAVDGKAIPAVNYIENTTRLFVP